LDIIFIGVFILETLFICFLFWEWGWEVGTLSNNPKTEVPKDPDIKLLRTEEGRPIIPIGWLLLKAPTLRLG
jgi:hypothetical protein